MAQPNPATTAVALLDSGRRLEIGDSVPIALYGDLVIETVATVIALEITDDGEQAILEALDRYWVLPIQSSIERAA